MRQRAIAIAFTATGTGALAQQAVEYQRQDDKRSACQFGKPETMAEDDPDDERGYRYEVDEQHAVERAHLPDAGVPAQHGDHRADHHHVGQCPQSILHGRRGGWMNAAQMCHRRSRGKDAQHTQQTGQRGVAQRRPVCEACGPQGVEHPAQRAEQQQQITADLA